MKVTVVGSGNVGAMITKLLQVRKLSLLLQVFRANPE